jgi:hypothetical protein
MGRLPQKAETHSRQINNENDRRAATAVEPTTKSSLFEVPLRQSATCDDQIELARPSARMEIDRLQKPPITNRAGKNEPITTFSARA